jgi:hypothetical protein
MFCAAHPTTACDSVAAGPGLTTRSLAPWWSGTTLIEAVRAEDRAAAKAEGMAEGKAEAVLVVLAARKVAVGDAERRRIVSEHDPAQLDRWLAEAAVCETVTALFTTAGRPGG